jgi:hypothetical protein
MRCKSVHDDWFSLFNSNEPKGGKITTFLGIEN